MIVVVVVVGACFGDSCILYATRKYDAESHVYETYSISIRAYVPHSGSTSYFIAHIIVVYPSL